MRAFEAVARYKSFTRAADELCVTAGAVSQQVKVLEEYFSTELFIRRNNRVSLSRAGEACFPLVGKGLDQLAEAADILHPANAEVRLDVRVMPTFAARWLIPRLAGFRSTHPDFEVRLITQEAPGDAVSIVYGDEVRPGDGTELLFREELLPVCAPSLIRDAKIREPFDLGRYGLIQVSSVPEAWPLWMRAAGVDPGTADLRGPWVDTCLMALEAAAEGVGVTLADRAFVERDLARGRLVAPFGPVLPSDAGWYLVRPTDRRPGPAVEAFREWLFRECTADRLVVGLTGVACASSVGAA
ncbi:MAG TPA: LysR substrate-binding domain-containing protein [Arenibaculum sp.]|nr:LysR substrate-binding domain-containing protein [Arenibaculum sp.]